MKLKWNDNSGDNATFSKGAGSGSAIVDITSDPNEGVDRSLVFNVGCDGIKRPVTLLQQGKRETFFTKDNNQFMCADGEFLVLKAK